MKITVTQAATIPPEVVVCDVSWTAVTGEELRARVHVNTILEALPIPVPVGDVPGLQETYELPIIVREEAIVRARDLAERFQKRDF